MAKPKKLTQEEKEDIACKIGSEGFDYYFYDYGADERLRNLIGKEIDAYITASKNLQDALEKLGIDWQEY